MANFFYNYGLFLIKALTLVAAILLTFGGIVAIAAKNKFKPKIKLRVTKLNEHYQELKETLNNATLDKSSLKKLKKQQQSTKKKDRSAPAMPERIFVLKFTGDLKASGLENLREEITAILTVATPKDEVLVKLESPGGMVPHYGLAASQLQRLRHHKIPLTIAIDKVAASGGYMMACVADRILAAPFAIIGSIGVIAQLPNFNRFLKKHEIDFEQITAGQYKRTLSLFGENSAAGREKLRQEVEETHHLFKNFVATNRPVVDIATLATGETWHGSRAQELHLVDEIITSDDYLLTKSRETKLFQVECLIKKTLIEQVTTSMQRAWLKLSSS